MTINNKYFLLKKIIINNFILLFFIFIPVFKANALRLAVDSPLSGIHWTMETVIGYQNVENASVDSKSLFKNTLLGKSGESSEKLLFYSGMIFNAQIEDVTFIKSLLNLGFSKNPHFIWTESPELLKEQNINELLQCFEYDIQLQLPFVITYKIRMYPFVGYSFIDYSYSDTKSKLSNMTLYNHYHTIIIGLQYRRTYFKWLSNELYISASPFVRNDGSNLYIRYFNYGGNLRFNVRPIEIVIFASMRTAYFSESSQLTNFDIVSKLNTTELGISFHINL